MERCIKPMTIRPVILCGGAGTRLWPVSRETFPKQLLPITADLSMLQQTAIRLSGPDYEPLLAVGSQDQRFFIRQQLVQCGAETGAILVEPTGRNTAAAAALAAEWLLAQGKDELLLLMPSDHVLGDTAAFRDAIRKGMPQAEAGAIVLFGAEPAGPNTQFGYIEINPEQPLGEGAFAIAQFKEKPDLATAESYVADGRHLWNSGILLARASVLIAEMQQFLPSSAEAVAKAVATAVVDGVFVRPDPTAFGAAENISIDRGLMEKTARGVVVPMAMSWSDVGSWSAVWEVGDKDRADNVLRGDVVAIDTHNSLLRTDGPAMIAAIGVRDTVVVATRDAIFVAPMDRAAEVEELVAALKAEDRACVTTPSKVARPWGSYESIGNGPRFQTKHIVVGPGETLSLQMHYHRSEHWIVVSGTALVTVGDRESLLHENESTYISAGTRHRLSNPGKVPLELIEVQCGTYLGEDDITRFNDEYGRA